MRRAPEKACFARTENGKGMGRTWSGIFCKNSKKHYYTSGADAETGRNATLFYMYFSPEENEQTIEFLLQEYPQFKICDIKDTKGFQMGF